MNASSPFSKASFTLIGPVWRTATEALEVFLCQPQRAFYSAGRDLLTNTVIPAIFGSSEFNDDFMIWPDQFEFRVYGSDHVPFLLT